MKEIGDQTSSKSPAENGSAGRQHHRAIQDETIKEQNRAQKTRQEAVEETAEQSQRREPEVSGRKGNRSLHQTSKLRAAKEEEIRRRHQQKEKHGLRCRKRLLYLQE